MFRLFGLLLVGLVLSGCQANANKYSSSWILQNTATTKSNFVASTLVSSENRYAGFQDAGLCSAATTQGNWDTNPVVVGYVKEAKRRGLSCGVGEKSTAQHSYSQQTIKTLPDNTSSLASSSTKALCNLATKRQASGALIWDTNPSFKNTITALKKSWGNLWCG